MYLPIRLLNFLLYLSVVKYFPAVHWLIDEIPKAVLLVLEKKFNKSLCIDVFPTEFRPLDGNNCVQYFVAVF